MVAAREKRFDDPGANALGRASHNHCFPITRHKISFMKPLLLRVKKARPETRSPVRANREALASLLHLVSKKLRPGVGESRSTSTPARDLSRRISPEDFQIVARVRWR
jgi:hypothetical protein